tara:strand:+ start:418 stop:621 length:204 start_codon:yes stop_codon:yes gene_type:complete
MAVLELVEHPEDSSAVDSSCPYHLFHPVSSRPFCLLQGSAFKRLIMAEAQGYLEAVHLVGSPLLEVF